MMRVRKAKIVQLKRNAEFHKASRRLKKLSIVNAWIS